MARKRTRAADSSLLTGRAPDVPLEGHATTAGEPSRPRGGLPFPSVPLSARPLQEARFLERPNRFLVRCRLAEPGEGRDAGETVEAHLPDPGRLRELLLPGRRIWLRPERPPPRAAARRAAERAKASPWSRRKTAYTAVLVESPGGDGLVSVDTTVPNRLVAAALEVGALEELAGWQLQRREAPLGTSRIDFLLRRARRADRGGPAWLALEVKSVTLVEAGVGLFPDAVTARGARHLRELAALARRDGWGAAVLFVVQRQDARCVVAAREIDPRFAEALTAARASGVRVLGRRCRVHPDRVELGEPVPAG